MWVDFRGSNFTSAQVVEAINRAGGSYTIDILESTYRIGKLYRNGSLWFQRLA